MLPFSPRVHAKQNLGINPPPMDGDTRMTESAAIAQNLVTKYGLTPLADRIDEPAFRAFLGCQYFGETTLTFLRMLVLLS